MSSSAVAAAVAAFFVVLAIGIALLAVHHMLGPVFGVIGALVVFAFIFKFINNAGAGKKTRS